MDFRKVRTTSSTEPSGTTAALFSQPSSPRNQSSQNWSVSTPNPAQKST